jgi:hypothetical protein
MRESICRVRGQDNPGRFAASGDLTPALRAGLLPKLAFAVAAHIAGGSFGGEVDGEEVYPVLGFSVGESADAVYFGDGAAMHEAMSSVLAELEAQPGIGSGEK